MSKKLMVFFLAACLFGLCSASAALAITLEVSISNPTSGSQYPEGTNILLQGGGVVVESNFQLGTNDLKWYANNQLIGKGTLVNWTPTGGTYNVRLVGDKEGATAVDEIEITVVSPQGFTVTVNILSPTAGTTFQLGEIIVLMGNGQVTETGEYLSDSDLFWMSSLDGALGTGSYLTTDVLTVGTHTIYLIGRQKAISSVQITVSGSSLYVPQPIKSGDAAIYNWATNTFYIPLMVEGVAYWVNLAVTSFTQPLTFELTGIGQAAFSPTASYADFNLLKNTVWVPVFLDQGVSYFLSLKLTNSEAPFTFELTGSGLNQ